MLDTYTHEMISEEIAMSKRQPAKKRLLSGDAKLTLAKTHLDRVRGAWDDPTDWGDLSLYGFFCVEAAVDAAALHLKLKTSTKHWEKADLAVQLHAQAGLPDISTLLGDLNDARKSSVYGDIEMPSLDAEEIAIEIESYVDAVEKLLSGNKIK